MSSSSKRSVLSSLIKSIKNDWSLYLLITPVIIYFLVFQYWPMYGVQIAFKDFLAVKGIWNSPWVGFKHFERFFSNYQFWRLLKNTLGISIYQLAVGFPLPILLALMMNEVGNKYFKKTVQMATYAPHFLSTVVLAGMVISFLSPTNGIINSLITFFGGKPIYFMAEPGWFKTIFVFSGVWQNAGWGSIIYMAALAGIDPSLYEAAEIDGASKIKRILYVTIPGILPTAIILLILDSGKIMNVGFEKSFLMQNPLNISSSEVISTYVYKSGLVGAQYSFATAVGLFNSVVNFILLLTVNKISKSTSETGLW